MGSGGARRFSDCGEETLKHAPDITYIVSAFNRPVMLPVILWALAGQKHRNFEVIVTDNATDDETSAKHRAAVQCVQGNVPEIPFRYVRTAKKIHVADCYHSAEYAIKTYARGQWYCFPCDDTYLAPDFGQKMLKAAYSHGWQFVYTKSVVVGSEASGGSGPQIWTMQVGRTVKTSFIVKASIFPGFVRTGTPAPVEADYFLGSVLRSKGIPMGSVDEIMVVHN